MKDTAWVNEDIEQLYEHNQDYIQKALINYCETILQEQKERIDLMEGQLDGTMWNHTKWS